MAESLFRLFADLVSRHASKCSWVLHGTGLRDQVATLASPLGLTAPGNSGFEDVFWGASDLPQTFLIGSAVDIFMFTGLSPLCVSVFQLPS